MIETRGRSGRSERVPVKVVELSREHAEEFAALARPISSVAVIGLGYVGLPTALGLEEHGHRVIGIDVSESRLTQIRRKRADLLPADRVRLDRALASDRFELTSDVARLVDADAVIVCVPTPIDAHLNPDVSYVEAACANVVAHAVRGQTIVLTSTTYVGSTRRMLVEPLEARGFVCGQTIFVAFSPERIDPGNTSHPQASVPRVVGGVTPACADRAEEVIGSITEHVHRVSSPEAAELTKLYENTFRAVNIALANEMADAGEALGIDFTEVIEAAATKPYGFMPFHASTGVGGHCIPCDPHYLLWNLRALRHEAPIVQQAMTAIAARPRRIVDRAIELLASDGIAIRNARVVVAGVAYKPGVEDVRESPALEIIERLRGRGIDVSYTDDLVPRITLHDGTVLESVDPADLGDVDLGIVHVLHPGADVGWLTRARRTIDPSGALRRRLARDAASEADGRDAVVDLPVAIAQ